MKVLKPAGIIGAILTFTGGMFKVQHYPGASIMLILGIPLTLVFLFSWFSNASKNATSSKERLGQITLFIAIGISLIAALFKIQHYPGGGVLWMASMVISLVFIPVYLIYLMSEKDESKKISRTAVFVFFLAAIGIMVVRGVSPIVLYEHVMTDQYIVGMTKNLEMNNEMMFNSLAGDTSLPADRVKQIKELKEQSDNLVQYIDGLKMELLKATGGDDFTGKPDTAITLLNLNAKDNFDIPTHIMINEAASEDGSKGKAAELKKKIMAYRDELLHLTNNEIANRVGLKTDSVFSKHLDVKTSWEIDNFYIVSATGVITRLDQLVNEVRFSETLALHQLMKIKK